MVFDRKNTIHKQLGLDPYAARHTAVERSGFRGNGVISLTLWFNPHSSEFNEDQSSKENLKSFPLLDTE